MALYLTASLILPLIPGPRTDLRAGDAETIGLLPGLIHYDLLLPLTPAVRERFAFVAAAGVPVADPEREWLIVGHGARTFYTTTGTAADLTLRALWLGATGDSSVMRVDTAGPILGDYGITWMDIGHDQFAALLDTVAASFAAPQVALAGPGLSGGDVFFPGTGRSDLLRTCNAWLGGVLRAAGVRFGLWTPATWSVDISLWRFGEG